MCQIAFLAAQSAYESHRAECRPDDADDHEGNRAYERSYGPLVDAMSDAGAAVIRCPAATAVELAEKLEIFRREELYNCEGVDEFVDVLIEDARRIGAAA
jgi:hypothetical protein